MTLAQFRKRFHTEEAARRYLESIRWPDGPVCPFCDSANTASNTPNPGKRVREGLYHCRGCRRQFTVTVGTPMHGTRIELTKWLLAWYIVSATKRPVSVPQLSRAMGVRYTRAWAVARRIRSVLPSLSN